MVASVPDEARALLRAHLLDLDAKLRPGELVLTWASLNVDGFLQSLQQARPRARGCARTSFQVFLACLRRLPASAQSLRCCAY